MKQKKEKYGIYSINKILALLAILLLVIVVVGISYIHHRQQNTLVLQAAKAQEQSLTSFLRRMDEGLARTENQLYNVLYNHAGLAELGYSTDEVSIYQAKQEVGEELSKIVQLSEFIECAWFYSPSGKNAEFLSRNNFTGITLKELLSMKESIKELLENPSNNRFLQSDKWAVMTVDGQDYLFWMTPVQDAYCGLWTSTSHLFSMLTELLPEDTDSQALLCSMDGQVLLKSGELNSALLPEEQPFDFWGEDYMNICSYSENTEIVAEIFLPIRQILKGRHVEFDYTLACAVLLIFVILAFLIFQILIYRPFKKLLRQIDAIAPSKPDIRLETDSRLSEAYMIENAVNSLLDKIHTLNTKIYNAELNERDIRCQYLQIRLKNHFYLNCLSIIHAMARLGHTELIQELTMCLVKYLRFVQEDTDKFVRLSEELEHVRNYARIQELRFPGLFEYQEHVSLELSDASVPPLMLQTFIENSVEHGMNREQKNQICVEAYYQEKEGMPGMYFSIQDNGKGFSKEDLEGFVQDPRTFDFSKSHGIGIRNIIGRLNLLYHGKASIQFSNISEGGARIEIWIPFWEVEEDMDHV